MDESIGERIREQFRARRTPEQRDAAERLAHAEREHLERVFKRMAERAVARLEEDVTPLLGRLLASAGRAGELRLVDSDGRVVRSWRSPEDLARDLIAYHD